MLYASCVARMRGYGNRLYQTSGVAALDDTRRTVISRLHGAAGSARTDQPAGTYLREIYARVIIDLSWASSRLEGNTYTICNLHALLTDNLLSTPEACGQIRSRPVGIRNSRYTPPSGEEIIRPLLDQVFEKGEQIKDPFEASFFVMVHIPYLSPPRAWNARAGHR